MFHTMVTLITDTRYLFITQFSVVDTFIMNTVMCQPNMFLDCGKRLDAPEINPIRSMENNSTQKGREPPPHLKGSRTS